MPARTSPRFRTLAPAAFALAALSLLSACADGAFVDRRRDAGQPTLTYVGLSTPDTPSICYNTWNSTPAEVLALARAECAKTDRVPELLGQSSFDCRLFYPARANFRCVAP